MRSSRSDQLAPAREQACGRAMRLGSVRCTSERRLTVQRRRSDATRSYGPRVCAHRTRSFAGRIMFKRAGGKGLVFYDIYADGIKLQAFCDARNFTAFQGDDGLTKFMALMNSVSCNARALRARSTRP